MSDHALDVRLHVRLWVDGELVVDEDIYEGKALSHATQNGGLAAKARLGYKVEISDPDGLLPTYSEEHFR